MSSFCMHCGAALPQGAMFCPKCGTKIDVPHCSACGKEVALGADFCIHCGHPLTENEKQPPTPIELPEPQDQPEEATKAKQDLLPPPASPLVDETPNGNGTLQFSWSYTKMGAMGIRKYNVAAALTDDTMYINEQRHWGWHPKSNDAELALSDIQELCIRTKASILYWALFAALITIIIAAASFGIFEPATYAILALFSTVFACLGSFQLLHNELTILKRNGNEIVLKGAKRELFDQLEQEIFLRAGVSIKAPRSAAAAIVLAIAIGAVGIIASLWIGSSGLLISDNPDQTYYESITEKDLIGCWQFQYAEFNNTGTIVYQNPEYAILRLYENGTYDCPGDLSGKWFIKGGTATLRNSTGISQTIHFREGTLHLTTSEKTLHFEKLSDSPEYQIPHPPTASQTVDYEPYEPSQPTTKSSIVPDTIYKVMTEKTVFPVREMYYNELSPIGMLTCDSILPNVENDWYNTTSFAIVDMDGDGENEVVLFGESEFDGLYTVLHEYEGSVYGFTVHYRDMNPLLANGLFESSDGAAYNYINKFTFSGSDAEIVNLAFGIGYEDGSYYFNETPVSQEMYDDYLAEMGWDWDNAAVFYDYTDANIQSVLMP